MRSLLTILFIFSLLTLSAQTSSTQVSVPATVTAQACQSLQVDLLVPQAVTFISSDEYNSGKTFNNYLGVTVKSTVPWLLNVRGTGPFTAGNKTLPLDIMSLTSNLPGGGLKKISQTDQLLLKYTNTAITNYITVGAKFDPGWNYSGGNYSTTLIFTLTPE